MMESLRFLNLCYAYASDMISADEFLAAINDENWRRK